MMLHLFKVCIMEHRESQAIATRGEGAPELRMAPSHPNIAVLGTGSIGQRHLAVLRFADESDDARSGYAIFLGNFRQ